MTATIVLGGVTLDNATLIPLAGTLQVRDAIGRESVADLDVLDLAAAQHYQQGTPLQVYDDAGALAFAGYLTSSKEQVLAWQGAATPALQHTIQATDNHYLANKRRAPKAYTSQTCGAMARDLVDTILATEGVYYIRNLLSANQSSIETNTSGWSGAASFLINAATIARTTSQAWTGSASLQVTTDGTHAHQGCETAASTVAALAGRSYTASAYVNAPVGAAMTLGLRDYTNALLANNVSFTGTGAWQRVSVTGMMGAAPVTDLRMAVYTAGTAAVTFYVDGAQIEPYPTATPWELGGTSTVQDGITVPSVTLGYDVTCAAALDALAQYATYWWTIDHYKRLWFVPWATNTAPWAFDGTQEPGGTVTVENTNPLYRNTQYAGGGTAQTSTQTETRKGDGNTQAWAMSYPLAAAPTITLNGTAQTVGIKQIDSGKQWYWAAGDAVIAQDSGGTKLTSSDTLQVVYVGQFPFIASSQDGAQTDAQAAIEGDTSGIVEDYQNDATLTSVNAAFAEVNAYLSRYSQTGQRLVFTTKQTGLTPGQLLTVTLPVHNLSGAQMLIEGVDLADQGGAQTGLDLWYTVTAILGPVDTSWVEFFKQLAQRQTTKSLQVGSSSTLVQQVSVTAAAAPSATFTSTVYACPLFPWTLPVTLC